jgi:hypothetical protein
MAAMTLEELKTWEQEQGFDDNSKIVVLVGMTTDGKFQIVQVDATGKLVTTT